MNIRELDIFETAGHTFDIVRLEKNSNFWICQIAIDGVLRKEFLEPAENVADLNSREFETYIKAQAIGMPPYGQTRH